MSNELNADIGMRIRQRRKELNLTQEELAIKLGYRSRSSINKIEIGERSLTQSKIKAIADALDTTPSFIMGWGDSKVEYKTSTTKEELISKIDQLDEANASKLLELCTLYLASQGNN